MKDITVIIPILLEAYSHPLDQMLNKAVDSVRAAAENYKGGKVKLLIVRPSDEATDDLYFPNIEYKYIYNKGNTDYCSQVNLGVENVDTEFFSILEFDDWYSPKWFKMFDEYYNTNEDVSVFLPINVLHSQKENTSEFVNEIVWASSFSSEMGVIDFECLENCASFNLTGGIFKTSDWLKYKPSIKVAFNYEYLLRATSKNKKQKIYVIPKEGYHHELFREGSLVDQYVKEIPEETNPLWFELARREYSYDEDRNKGIIEEKVKADDLK